jgi:hypothetical protein
MEPLASAGSYGAKIPHFRSEDSIRAWPLGRHRNRRIRQAEIEIVMLRNEGRAWAQVGQGCRLGGESALPNVVKESEKRRISQRGPQQMINFTQNRSRQDNEVPRLLYGLSRARAGGVAFIVQAVNRA